MTDLAHPANVVVDPTQPAAVAIVCVTYNSAPVIEAFLSSLPAALEGSPPCRIVVTDNASRDGTPELIAERAPWVTLIRAGGNVGYSAGINLALRELVATEGVFILNPDTVPAHGSVAALLDTVRRDPSVGIAVPRILDSAGRTALSLRREPAVSRAFGEALLGGPRAARFRLLGEVVADPSSYRDRARADWATGAALFITRPAMDKVGEWDERFFLYSEETDYCLRVRDAGLALQLVAGAEVVHQGGDQSSSPGLWALSAVNRTRLYRKRHRLPASTLHWIAVVLNEAIRAAAGRPVNRAALRALLACGPNPRGTEPTTALLARAGSPIL